MRTMKRQIALLSVLMVLIIAALTLGGLQLFGKGKAKPSEWFKKADKPQVEQTEQETPKTASVARSAMLSARSYTISDTPPSSGMNYWDFDLNPLNATFPEEYSYVSLYYEASYSSSNGSFVGKIYLDGGFFDIIYGEDEDECDEDAGQKVYISKYPDCDYSISVSGKIGNQNITYTSDFGDGNVMFFFTVEDAALRNTFFAELALDFVTINYTYTPEVVFPTDPVKEGHRFVGWYYDEALTRPYDGKPITADIQLYAKFEINRYTITYNANGGEAVESVKVDWSSSAPVPVANRLGYNFLGWFLDDGTQYTNQPIKANTKLTAHWEIKTFTVTFYVDGEKYSEKTVEYGTALVRAMEAAQIASYMAMTTEGVRLSKQNSLITEDTHVVVKELSGWEKYGDFVARNQWYTWTLVGIGGVLLILAVVGIVEMVRKR